MREITHFKQIQFILVGTNTDLRTDLEVIKKLTIRKQKVILPEQGKKLANEVNAIKYIECSALTQVTFFRSMYFCMNFLSI